jgi:hypothetical protein
MSKISTDEEMRKWTVHMCRHPCNIMLRPGILSRQWTDLAEIVAARKADIMNERGGIVTFAEFLRRLDDENVSLEAAVRWALMLSKSGRFNLQLQALPGLATTLNSKPSLKR